MGTVILAGTLAHAVPVVERASVDEAGVPFVADRPALSRDGSVLFFGTTTGLVPEDANGLTDYYRRDMRTGEITLLTRSWDGSVPGFSTVGCSDWFSASSDGGLVALIMGGPLSLHDDDASLDVYLYDHASGSLTLVSVESDGEGAVGVNSCSLSLSADGTALWFVPQFDLGPSGGALDLVRHDVATGVTTIFPIHAAASPDVSADGRYVAYQVDQIHVLDTATGAIRMASVADDGTPSDDDCWGASVSDDGTRVAFTGYVNNLADEGGGVADTGGGPPVTLGVYVHDFSTGNTDLISRSPGGVTAFAHSGRIHPTLRIATFGTATEGFVPGGEPDAWHIYAWRFGHLVRVDTDTDGNGLADHTGQSYAMSDHSTVVVQQQPVPTPVKEGNLWLRQNPTCDGLAATVVGTGGNDTLVGTDGPDVIVALDGDDIIEGLGGDDVLCGGSGVDVITGGDGVDRLFGQVGDDVLDGGGGDDTLSGGAGDDWLLGAAGDDACDGGIELVADAPEACEFESEVP